MSKTQLWAFIVVIAIVIAVGVLAHDRSKKNRSVSANPTQTQITAANDCVTLCQAVFEESGNDTTSQKEQTCENTCYTSAGLPVSTSTGASSTSQ